jgi:GNAT superfamily N-acetyltransferase
VIVERLDPHDEAGFRALGDHLLPMAGEVAIVPVNMADAAEELWLAVAEGNTFVAKTDDGRVVGSLAIVKGPHYWYNRSRYFFIDHHFYVAQDQRFALVGVKLLRFARDNVEPKGEAIFIRVVNRHRHQKGVSDAFYATIAGYVPFGDLTLIRKPTEIVAPEVPAA